MHEWLVIPEIYSHEKKEYQSLRSCRLCNDREVMIRRDTIAPHEHYFVMIDKCDGYIEFGCTRCKHKEQREYCETVEPRQIQETV